jgi:hypothetical protein
MKSCEDALDLFQDVVGLGSLDKRLWFFVVMINVFSTNDDQFFDTVEEAAAQPVSVRSRRSVLPWNACASRGCPRSGEPVCRPGSLSR